MPKSHRAERKNAMTKVLFVAAEAMPFCKSGGLGEVIGSLPKALKRTGVDARVIIPKYQSIPAGYQAPMKLVKEIIVPVGWRRQSCGLYSLSYGDVTFYFVGNAYYFNRQQLYGHYDEAERYAFFDRAVLEALPHLDFQPDVIHCHDWHTGLVPAYLAAHYRRDPYYWNMRTVFTIHNLKYQGVFSKAILGDIVDLGWEHFTMDKLEFFDKVNYMKAGLAYADRLTTVSPSYAREIRYPFFGEQLNGFLERRAGHLSGIVNGIDCEIYDPASDPHIFQRYDVRSLHRKSENKPKLQHMLGLPVAPEKPLVAIISRLVAQKGLDLVARVLDDMLALDIQLVVMGNGEDWYRALFWEAAARHPNRVAPQLNYDEPMARRIWAAADLFLMPSLYEPCGIAQLTAMRYGTLPLVRETGGLRDTVRPYNKYTGEGNGFSFANYNAHEMLGALRSALDIYWDKPVWTTLMKSAMTSDCTWDQSARQYVNLYEMLTGKEALHASAERAVPTRVPWQTNEPSRQTPGRDLRRRTIPSPEQPYPGLYWPSVVGVAAAATGSEAGVLPVY
jgi:starch synthase